MGLDPRTPGSHPELKADAQPLSHPDIPLLLFFKIFYLFIYLREREIKQEWEGAEGEGEADSPLSSEPDAGLDIRTLRS